jgi:hypothetical protein
LPPNFEVPAWAPPSELDLADAPVFSPHPKKRPATLSNIAQQPEGDDEEEQDDEDDDFDMGRPGKTPTPP